MSADREVVITGVGVVSPIGIGREALARSLRQRRSGVGILSQFDSSTLPVPIAGEVTDFDAKQYVKPRKSLKVMSREMQFGFAAAALAFDDAGLTMGQVDPDRMGAELGCDMLYCDVPEIAPAFAACMENGAFDFDRWGEHALAEMYPLWLLKYLPNMASCHVGIAFDARGPNNSITHGDVSGLMAIAEAARVIERGAADVMFAGGTGTRIHPSMLTFRTDRLLSHRGGDPAAASRPFDADRDGLVNAEGAGVVILESRAHAEARKAKVCATLASYAAAFEARGIGGPIQGTAIRASIRNALQSAQLAPEQVGMVSAAGLSTRIDDAAEAAAIRDELGDVPVTALKSYHGDLGAGTGAVELAATILALAERTIPATLNYETPDPGCPVRVVHGSAAPLDRPTALVLGHSLTGQSAALVLHGTL